MSDLSRIARHVRRCGAALAAVGALALGAPTASSAEPVKCQRSVLKRSDALAQATAKALRQCEERKRKGKLPLVTVCASEPTTAGRIAKAEAKLAARIAKDCGGKDRACGTADDDTVASIAWPAQCPDFAGRGCTRVIASCADVAACVGCVNGAVVDQAVTLAYGALVPTDKRRQRKLHACQGAIGAELLKLQAALAKPLVKCWDRRHNGKHANLCPEPGDGKAAPRIAKARAKLVAKLCKVCGGTDKACGGDDDFSPAEIGFVATCPAVGTCGGPVGTLAELTDCLTCVADLGVGCALSLSVPGFVSYPGTCAAAVPTPTVTSTSTPLPTPTASATPGASATPIVVGTATTTMIVPPTASPGPSSTPGGSATATATPAASATVAATPTGTPTATATATATLGVTPTSTPTPVSMPCQVGTPGTGTTLVTVSLITGQPIGAASMLVAYPPDLVRLPGAGGGTAVRARVTDLTGGELFDKGSPNDQDSDGDEVPDRVRLSVVSTTGVTGAVLAVELDRCDGARATIPSDYACTLAHVVGTDGVTPIGGAACAVAVVP